MMSDTLFIEPQRDQFQHESPIRAFTDWSTQGHYAIGKGFRPSVQHLVSYLDAMERKENWRVVQVLDAGNGLTMLFRQAGLKIMPEPCGESSGEPIPYDADKRARFVYDNETDEEPYVNEERMARFVEAGEKMDAAEKIADAMDELPRYMLKLYGFNAKKIKELMERYPGDTFEVIIGENKEVSDLDLPEGWMFTGWRKGGVAIFERTRPAVAPYEHTRSLQTYDKADTAAPNGKKILPVAQTVKIVIQDDPVNPKHYAGRACADIGEHLTANSYQVLKYCWRLGKKDDALIELGKALWYLNSERSNILLRPEPRALWPMGGKAKWFGFCAERTAGQSALVQNLVNALSRWSFAADSSYLRIANDAIEAERDRLMKPDCASGLAV